MPRFQHLLIIASLGILFIQCSESNPAEPEEIHESTYDIIQTRIFDKNCVSCHQEGTSFAKQSDLVLTKGRSYPQLINRQPNNTAASADGLVLVGTKGLPSVSNSFLWEKVNIPDYAHFYDDHSEYGELMPLGGQSLTNGELHFLNEWIIQGAPDTGIVVDKSVLDDDSRFVIPAGEFERFTPPASGLQLNIGPFDIMPQSEREFFYYEPLDNTEDIFINRVEITMREGSHHFILYDYPDGDIPTAENFRDIYKSDGSFNILTIASILNQRFVFGTQWRNTDYTYPPGVALRLPTNTGFDLNSHYVNHTDDVKTGEVSVNLHTIPKNEVQKVAQNLFESFEDINLPAGQVTTLDRTSRFSEKMHIFQLTSHAHKHMEEFEIYIVGGARDGELIYFTQDWEHPPLLTFDPPITLESGQGLRARATYNNDTNRTLKFGLLSEDEMMIMFGAFYTD